MKFFLVFQGDTYEEEKKLSCLWAPKLDRGGDEQHHHRRLLNVDIGDHVVHLENRKIRAFSKAISKAYDSDCPREFSKPAWPREGRKVDLDLTEFDEPIDVDSIFSKIKDKLPEKYSPFNIHGGGNQGYFYEIGVNVFNTILDTDFNEETNASEPAAQNINSPTGSSTLSNIVNTRSSAWQNYFKKKLFKLWPTECAITKVKNKKLLIGAHIRPWSKSNDDEKLDEYNGLLLAPNPDKIFELGLISFEDNGKIIISSKLSNEDLTKLNINKDTVLNLKENHKKYIKYHRENKFKK